MCLMIQKSEIITLSGPGLRLNVLKGTASNGSRALLFRCVEEVTFACSDRSAIFLSGSLSLRSGGDYSGGWLQWSLIFP